MSLAISPMTESEIPVITQLLQKAYVSPNGISGLLLTRAPSQESLDQLTAARLRAFREDPTVRYMKATDGTTGEIIATAKWHFYATERSEADAERDAVFPADETIPEFNMPMHNALLGPLRRAHKDIMGTKPHAFLSSLVADLEQGRRGAGGMLVQWGLDRADELGLETYLDATPMGRGLYEKNGFEVVKEIPFDLAPWGGEGTISHVCMVRKPQLKT